MEAKGRTNDYEESVLQAAKAQTQRLSTIQGTQPVLRVASLAYFATGNLEFVMRDPERNKGEELFADLPLTKRDFLATYYRPFLVWVEESTAAKEIVVAGHKYRTLSFPEFDLVVGLSEAGAGELGGARSKEDCYSRRRIFSISNRAEESFPENS